MAESIILLVQKDQTLHRQNYRKCHRGATVLGAAGSYNESKLYSLISRASFNLYGKYIITGSLRADGSSKFGENEKWGYFPSISGGYILSEEDWFKSEAFNFVKLRASYGVTANDTGIGAYDALAGVSSTPYAGSAGTAITEIGNPNVKWEVTSQFNVGFSLGLFDNIVSVEYDYFDKNTDDLLLNIPLAYSSGFSSFYGNVGEMSNSGHEVSVDVQIFDRDDFNWKSSLGFSTLDNEVTSLDGNSPFTRGFASRVQEGEELGAFYVLDSDGLYQEGDEIPSALAADGVGAGDVKYVDQNGDGIINDSVYIIGGSPWADFTASWTNNIQYKNFDLYFLWAWSEGNDVFNSTLQYTGSAANPVYGKFTNQLDYWTPDNTNTNTPRSNYSTSAYNNYDSTRLVEDGSFIKLRNVTLGYTLPKDLLGFGSIRFYASADNLLMFTDYSGIDPEVNYSGDSAVTSGTDFLTQGGNKVYKFGVNINF
ncbi:SusC/RagA family TonB-linked outer membrane protein [Zunongwangia sp. SCSIO 43204]|uniref:SusC/RagA family TonB-linked outer membrane protein n=1 Tax=Zunongwangia sp. SCSIO 43204 TaxID=2779359 RepID=UPI001CA82216|nr:SusC/RagA family TonB-linked outer membrane protein [Zunongwangia sp. SCSIO 43204]UAB84715.1 SusC/RagA family TonB-linked outer membrane protein [Zunongwangia sp. SCSIO 43204]